MAIWDAIRDLLFRLTPYMPAMVGVLVVVAIGLIVGLVVLLRRSRQKDAAAAEDAPRGLDDDDYQPFATEPDDLPLLPMRKSFRHAMGILKTHVSGRDWRYAIPWYLLVGPEQSGKSTLAAHTGMDTPVGQPAEDFEDLRPACKWWFFDRGVILDVAGGLIRQHDGRNSNVKAWRRFLNILDDTRPRRPADGIVLTVPIEDLLDDDGVLRLPEDIAQRADAVYKKMWQAQARLGLAFPIYVVVTKADRLPGFQALVANMPEHALADMLGWSSPYNFDSEFRETWVDEAMDTVGEALTDAEMSIFADGCDAETAEEIYRLPNSFEALREPLRLYMRQLFKASSYHETFALRGIWFTGDSGVEPAAALRPAPVLTGVYGGPRPRGAVPVFLRDLFEMKIFPERNMARPVKRALLSRNKTATFAQAASAAVLVLGSLTLWVKEGALHDDVASVTPFIEEVRRDMTEVGGTSGSFSRERALSLLEGMAEQETGSFFSLVIPTSWVADVDDRVVDLTTEAFNLFILQAMRAALEERGTSIAAGRLPPAQDIGAGDPSLSVETGLASQANTLLPTSKRGPEYEALRRYVDAVRAFEAAVQRYNGLGESNDLADVRRLVAYLFSFTLPESFLEDSDFYDGALAGATYETVVLGDFSSGIQTRYRALETAALASLYADNALLGALRSMASDLDAASNSRTAGASTLFDLSDRIAILRTKLDDPAFAWMGDPAFDPAIGYAALSERIQGSQTLGASFRDTFDTAHVDGVTRVHEALRDIRALSIGPLLDRDGDVTVLRLAPDVLTFYAVAQSMAAQPFMQTDRARPLPSTAPPGSAVEWDVPVLEEAHDLVAAHDAFLADELDRVPRALQPLMRTAAAERLERSVNDRIAGAMVVPRSRATSSVRSEDALRRSVLFYGDAGQQLLKILAVYDDLGLEDSYLDLLDLVLSSGFSLIEQADALFSAEPLYIPQGGDFRWWDGGSGLALDAFRARDTFDLLEILGQQRGRAEIIASGYVAPVVEILDALEVRLSDREAALLSKWQRIVDELTKYNLKQADNTVSELERFVSGPLMEVNFANCGELLGDDLLGRRSADFFLDRMGRLARAVRGRCLALAGIEAQTAYNAIIDSFDDNLSGRYPFTLTPYETDMREVTPRELRSFFAQYDQQLTNARLALEQAEDLGLERDRALEFLVRMDTVRALFDPWLSSTGGEDAPVFNLKVSFRVNRAREVGADQVIDWRLAAGPDVASLRDSQDLLAWGLGEPITVSLRWAENSVLVPAVSVDRPDVRVSNRTVEITYDNLWALMELVRRHRSGSDDFTEFVDPKPHTLRFEQPTRPAGGGTIDEARLFIRVEISGQKDGQPVPLVLVPFPYEAPRLEP